ncbi:unconventional myosin-XVIIIa-like isoform X1 [Chenopodium quinoa]|uniref:unconventional myosin-XVIIIa-like isoform X1 n=1 Tax=Chenopodium quinoa TaxID=63459 RepID=UPI000B795881|nr:unconventional myosin-XVIIIa-like isoform X1 [Chenopodium quinoa]XP_021762310.1 unconventional myosin-XVIIIa-like isoform X1 [Chenopodium quinoa]
MEFFQRAKVFRLKTSNQSKYLIADQDEDTVKQTRDSSSTYTRWSFELVEGKTNVIRIRSCNSWKYLAASEEPFLLGMTGKRVAQRPWLGATVEWEPIKEGPYIKLRSHTGTFLRSNKGLPPWRNTITHDLPGHWTASENMILWIVDIVEIDHKSTNGDSKSFKGNAVPSRLSNAVDHKSFSSCSTLSIEDDGPSTNSASSLEHSARVSSINGAKSSIVSEYSVQSAFEDVQTLEVKRAKQTFEQLKNAEFCTILSLGQDKKLEKAVDVLIADAKSIGRGKIPSKLVNIQEQLKSMKNDHELASQILVEHSTFSTKRLEIRDELKKDAAKARELQDLEVNVNNTIVDARAKREELLKQLEETENAIKKVEKARSDSMVEVEELISRIEQKSEGLKEMESKEKSWRVRKNEAERLLERVEKDWGKVKNSFSDV